MSRGDFRFSGPCLPSLPPWGGNLLWTQNMPENDGSTCDDKGNKEFLQEAEQEITDRLEIEKKKKNLKITGLITLYLSPSYGLSIPPSLPISFLFHFFFCWRLLVSNNQKPLSVGRISLAPLNAPYSPFSSLVHWTRATCMCLCMCVFVVGDGQLSVHVHMCMLQVTCMHVHVH